jgi:hypothetical protein
MKFRHQVLRVLPVVVLVGSLLPAPAWAQFTQQGPKLVGTVGLGELNTNEGGAVSISSDGKTAIVGGYAESGAVGGAWVFTRSNGVWSQQGAKLVGTGAVNSPFLEEGRSVSLSGDGTTAILGGPGDDGNVGAAWVFVQPVFAGTPGTSNCYGQSVSAEARQFGGLNAAAAALGFSNVNELQNAILAFCGG